MFLALIETSGNQDYIFASNKLRENVGASELIWRIGYRFVQEAMAEHAGRGDGGQVELVLQASGKALLRTEDRATAEAVIRAVTYRSLREAPGMDLRGAVCEVDQAEIHEVVQAVHRRHERLRGQVPGPQERFQRLPIIAECSTSGLPASRIEPVGEDVELRSEVSWSKRRAADDGWKRLRGLAGDVPLAENLDDLERLDVDWLGVVHADGNGLGQMFLDFGALVKRLLGRRDNEQYLRILGEFSAALDRGTAEAFRFALRQIWPSWVALCGKQGGRAGFLPLVPLVIGGDDLTVVCEGRLAIPFTVAYLQEFERQMTQGIVGDLAEQRDGIGERRLAACAGISIVKPHYPFYAAYSLAEQLLRSAKTVKEKLNHYPCSAFDVHVLYDASGSDLDRLRDPRQGELVADQGATRLTARPFVVTGLGDLARAAPAGRSWAERRHVNRLRLCLEDLLASDEDGRRRLPNGLLHELRLGLFQGRAEADARLRLALGRPRESCFGHLIGQDADGQPTLFADDDGVAVTTLLDAMDLADFWKREDDDGR